LGKDNLGSFVDSLKENLNTNYLPLSGFDSFEIDSLSYEEVQEYSGLYRFTVTLHDKATNKEVRRYVLISML